MTIIHSHMQDWSAVIGSVYERIIEQLVQLLQNIYLYNYSNYYLCY